MTAPAPHRPFTSACADREDAVDRSAAAHFGVYARPAPTPVVPRTTEPGQTATHTLAGCPARGGSAPCLCIRGQR